MVQNPSPTLPPPQGAALVLFSGGQDSSVCLAWALQRHARVETVGFDYGQRHSVELEARLAVACRYGGKPCCTRRSRKNYPAQSHTEGRPGYGRTFK